MKCAEKGTSVQSKDYMKYFITLPMTPKKKKDHQQKKRLSSTAGVNYE